MTYRPHKAYYAFTAFSELRKCGTAVRTAVSGAEDLWVTAARGEKGAAVMLANDSDKAIPLSFDLQGRDVIAVRITDKDRTDVTVPLPSVLPARAFAVIVLR